MPSPIRAIAFCLLALTGIGSGVCLADPLADSSFDAPVVPDPLPTTHAFPLGVATSGTAMASPMLKGPDGSLATAGCSALNPCALATPALDNVAAAKKKSKLASAK